MAFGVEQALQVVYVRAGQRLDVRLWARLSARQRGRWKVRDAASGRIATWCFLVLVAAQTVWLDLRVLPMLREVGTWVPASTTLLLANIAALMLLGLAAFARELPDADPSQVAPNVWHFEVHEDPGGGARFGLALGILLAALFAFLGWHTPDRGDAAIMAVFTAAALAYAGERWWALVRARRSVQDPLRVTIRQTALRPAVLVCRADLPVRAGKRLATRGWEASLVATGWERSFLGDPVNVDWWRLKAPMHLEPGSNQAEFTFRVALPAGLHPGETRWTLHLSRGSVHYQLGLPGEVIFPERAAGATEG